MDYSSLPIRSIVFSMSAFGALIGLMVGLGRDPINKNHIWLYISSFSVFFAWIGWRIIKWMAEKSESVYYESETIAPIQQDAPPKVEKYFVVHLNGSTHRISFFGMTVEQWQELSKMVVSSKAYKQPYFEKVLADREEGRNVYYDASGRLNYNDIFLTVHGNGFKLTDAGLEFFEKVEKGDWRVLDELDGRG